MASINQDRSESAGTEEGAPPPIPVDPIFHPYPRPPKEDETFQTSARDLRALVEMADEIMNAPDRETLFRSAVELARTRLGFHRCALFLREPSTLRGTFGTDLEGRTTDERAYILPLTGKWLAQIEHWDADREHWMIESMVPLSGPGAGDQQGAVPWAVVTPVKGKNKQTIAMFCNDPGLTGDPIVPHKQHLLAIFCSLLGSILERQLGLDALFERDRMLLALTEATQPLLTLHNQREGIELALRIMGDQTRACRSLLVKQRVSAGEDHAQLTIPAEWHAGSLASLRGEARFLDLFRLDEDDPPLPELASRTLVALDRQNTSPTIQGLFQDIGIAGLLIAPILIQDTLWGFFVLGYPADEDAPDSEPLQRAVATIAGSLAGCIGRIEAEEILRTRDLTLSGVASAINVLLTAHAFEQGVLHALSIVGRAEGIDRVFIVENIRNALAPTPHARLRFLWSEQIAEGTAVQAPVEWTYDTAFPGWYQIMKEGQTIHGHVLDLLSGTRFAAEPPEVRSILFAPIMVEGDFWGFVGFDDGNGARSWTRNDRSVLNTLAGSLGGAIARQRAEDTLRESENQFRSLIENASDMILEISPEGQIHYASPSVGRELGHATGTLLGKPFFQWVHPDDQPRLLAACTRALTHDREQPLLEFRLMREDRSQRWIETAVTPSRLHQQSRLLILNARDISDRKRSEEALQQSEALLRHSQKMEAMGRLAGGVAHDFNNLLTVILGYSEMLGKHLPEDHLAQAELTEMSKAAQRAHALTRQLLAFSRKQTVEPGRVEINRVVEDMQTLLERSLTENIEIETRLAPDAGIIQADPSQIEQIVINLALNARDAMPEGGRLVIESMNETIRSQVVIGPFTLQPGEFVVLRVHDTGVGMTNEVMAHLFEPFFTTKEVGKGTGLGLSMVYGIISQHEGQILVESQPGRGSTFSIFFPRVDGRIAEPPPPPEHAEQPGSETLLVVEDEDTVRRLAEKMLVLKGYRVLTAANGREALEQFQSRQDAIDLVLTDVVMPGMSGRALTEHIRSLRPDIPIVYMSGYARNSIDESAVLINEETFVQKPFTPAVLYRKIRHALDRAQA